MLPPAKPTHPNRSLYGAEGDQKTNREGGTVIGLSELKREWRQMGRGRLLYGSRRDALPFELWSKGCDLVVAWYDDYLKSFEFDWVLVKDNEIIKQFDYSPSLTDLFEVNITRGA